MGFEFKQSILPNGLTIIAEISDEAHTAAVGFFTKTGCRDESLELMGVSHFLEHMMFKGTSRRTAEDVNREFDELGASYNASTSHEVTNYWAHVLPEYLPNAIDLISDMLRPALRTEDFDMEKNVILEEIGMYADRPFWVVYEQAMAEYFKNHPLGYRVLGTNDSIKALSAEQMRHYFNQRYSPDNIVVSLAGRLDFDTCVDQLQNACAKWTKTSPQRNHADFELNNSDHTLKEAKLNRHYVIAMMPAPAEQDETRYAAAVLANLLGDSDGSRLYWKLIDPGLAEEAELTYQPFDGVGAFMLSAMCDPDRAEQVENAANDVLDNVASQLTQDEVTRACNKIATHITLASEQPLGRMIGLGRQWMYHAKYRSLEEELQRLMAVNTHNLKALLSDYPLEPRTTVRLTPGK